MDSEAPKLSLNDLQNSEHPAKSALSFRDFRYFQLTRLFGLIAAEMEALAIGWQLYQITGRALDLGYAGLAQFLPAFLLVPITGHVADHFNKKHILTICNSLHLACNLLLLLFAWRPPHSVLPIYITLIIIGCARAFAGPASQAMLSLLVPSHYLTNAITWSSSVFQFAIISGPAIGGVIYGVGKHATYVYFCSSILFLLSIYCNWQIQTRFKVASSKRAPSLSTIAAGLHYVLQHKILLGAISLDLFAVLLGGAVGLLPIFAKDILSIGPWGLGILRSTPAIGAMCVAIGLIYWPIQRRAGVVMLFSVALFGVATIVFGLSRSLWLSLMALFVMGASDMISVVIRSTLVHRQTPEEMKGRVGAVNLLFVGASNELGQFESGVTAAWWGPVRAVIYGGIGTLCVVALWARLFPSLRKADRLNEKTAH